MLQQGKIQQNIYLSQLYKKNKIVKNEKNKKNKKNERKGSLGYAAKNGGGWGMMSDGLAGGCKKRRK